jgi:uncharacterized OsmC-like protein
MRHYLHLIAPFLLLPFFAQATNERIANSQYVDPYVNNIDVKAVKDTMTKLKKDPEAGKITFFSDTKWQTGTRSSTTLAGYSIDGKMIRTKERLFSMSGDEIKEMAGTDTAPGAVEELMYALGTCITSAAVINASLLGVKLSKLDVALESDIDLHGALDVGKKIPPRIVNLRTKISIAGDADEETLKKIARAGYELSPVSDTVRNGVLQVELPKITVVK